MKGLDLQNAYDMHILIGEKKTNTHIFSSYFSLRKWQWGCLSMILIARKHFGLPALFSFTDDGSFLSY